MTLKLILTLAVCCLALTGCGVIATSSTTAPKASAKSTTTATLAARAVAAGAEPIEIVQAVAEAVGVVLPGLKPQRQPKDRVAA